MWNLENNNLPLLLNVSLSNYDFTAVIILSTIKFRATVVIGVWKSS